MTNSTSTSTRHQPETRRTIENGRAIIHRRLSKSGKWAIMEEEDYRRIAEEHGGRPWFFNDNGTGHGYVRLHSHLTDNLVMVARLVKGAPPKGKVLRYRDHNPLNLRRENLTPSDGRFAGTRKNRRKRPEVAPDEFAQAGAL